MNRIARTAATGAVLALATLSLSPVAAVAKGGPSIAQIQQQEAAANHATKAQLEYIERTNLAAQQPTKAQVEYVERSNAPVSSNPQNVQAKLVTDNGDAAAWQMALSAAAGVALTAGFVLASRGVSRHRHALAG